MGDRDQAAVTLDAFAFAPGHVVVVAGKGPGGGDVRVRGGLAAEVVAVHAPGTFSLEDDPHARAEVRLLAPRGVTLVRTTFVPATSRATSPAPVSGDRRGMPIDSPSPSSRSARPTPDPR